MDSLETQIKTLQSNIYGRIKYMNCGGCIHFAYYFSKKLKELGIAHKVFFTDWQPIDLTRNVEDGFSHVMVYIEDIGYIDGTDIYSYKKTEKYYRCKNTSLRKLNMLRSKEMWNPMYHTHQNDLVEKLVNTYIYG